MSATSKKIGKFMVISAPYDVDAVIILLQDQILAFTQP